MRFIWRLEVLSKIGSNARPYYSKDKSLTLRSAASWRKSGYQVRVDRVTIRMAKESDRHHTLWGWPLVIRDRGPLNNSRTFRRYQACITRPVFYQAKNVTVILSGVVLEGLDSVSYSHD